jgi:hypothetical protein
MAIRFKGTNKVVANLSKRVEAIKKRTAAGLMQGALVVKRRSMQLTPHDTGNLKGTCYTKLIEHKGMPVAEIGYTAAYAIYVHEINRNYKKPGTQWKYLETAMKEKQKEVLIIIRQFARIL